MRQHPEQFVLLLGQPAQVIAGGFEGELSANAGKEFGGVKGFGDVIDAACFERADDEVFVVSGGEKNNWNFRAFGGLAEKAADFAAVHLGHNKVEQNQIRGASGAARSRASWPLSAGMISQLPTRRGASQPIGRLPIDRPRREFGGEPLDLDHSFG